MDNAQLKHFQDGFKSFGEKYPNILNTNYPGIKLFPHYRHFLTQKIIDFGCGDGATVKYLNARGFCALGYDAIKIDNEMNVCDITESIGEIKPETTGLCMDVMEHLADTEIKAFLVANFARCSKMVLSVSKNKSLDLQGNDLHVNKKSFVEWMDFLGVYIKIKEALRISGDQLLILGGRV